MVKLRVSRRAAFMHKGHLFSAGTILSKAVMAEIPTENIGSFLKSGHLVEVGGDFDSEEDDMGAKTETPPIPAEITQGKKGDKTARDLHLGDAKGERILPVGKWDYDPSDPVIQKMTLEELNRLVIEKDGDMEPFESKEEALAQLSADFRENTTAKNPIQAASQRHRGK